VGTTCPGCEDDAFDHRFNRFIKSGAMFGREVVHVLLMLGAVVPSWKEAESSQVPGKMIRGEVTMDHLLALPGG
jgi:hypothetical protein